MLQTSRDNYYNLHFNKQYPSMRASPVPWKDQDVCEVFVDNLQ